MLRRIARLVVPAALAVGSLSLAIGAPASGAAAVRSHAAVARTTVTWAGVVDTVNLKKHHFVYTWDGGRYTVTYSARTKFTNGTAKKLRKGLNVTVTGSLRGNLIAATKIVL